MRILVTSPAFFGYESAIIDEFRTQGHEVFFLDERPSNSPLARAIARTLPMLMKRRLNRHFQRALDDLTEFGSIDAVLVIKGELVPYWFLTELKRRNQESVFVYYTYDSLANSAQGMRNLNHFDRLYSFDPADVQTNEEFELKELFYCPAYLPSGHDRDLDLSFVGTLHGDRYAFTQAVASTVPISRRHLFYYMPAKWFYIVRKLTSRDLRAVSRKDVSFVPLSQEDTVTVAQRSRVVIDLQRAGQTGLTMRTFEVLATGAAIITANDSIRDHDFFTEDRVLVVPRNPALIDSAEVLSFIERQPIRGEVPPGFESHSLASWVADFAQTFHQLQEARNANHR